MEIVDEYGNVLHLIHRKQDFTETRNDLVDAENFIQVSALRLDQGKTFKAHKHLWQTNFFDERIAQESWVVISGNVEVFYYDSEGEELHRDVLGPGDCSITLEGGHNYRAMSDALVYEFKTGPYEGKEYDKTEINV